jgi:[acyl-carrier-protein] S-malonyltransferase
MPGKKAFIFPGQGSQYVGMGRELFDEFHEAKEIFEQVDEVCQKPISKLCFEGPLEELTLTVNLQPALTAVNLVCLSALKRSGIDADLSAGHSLGEYSALTSAGVITPYDALRLVQKRGELMHRESLANPGIMTAVLGMEIDMVADIVARAGDKGVIAIANHNTAQQIVITGEREALDYAAELVKENGGKAIPLKVSGAWHCDLMKNAVEDFHRFMKDIPFSRPEGVLFFNSTADTEEDPEEVKSIMAHQLTSPVKWYDIMCNMLRDGVDTFVEVGPKKVLSGLLRKIIPGDRDSGVYHIEDLKSLNSLLEEVK